MREAQLRQEIVETASRLYRRGLLAANEGNVSVRDGDTLLVTPAGVCKGYLTPEMIVATDLHGRELDDAQRVSSEARMHVAIYERRADARAVVHAHPPTATSFAVAGIPLDRPLIAEAVVTLGAVPVVPYGTPSTSELADNVAGAICEAHGLLMANHGALTVGASLAQAWERMETIEQLARIMLNTRLLGQGNRLEEDSVRALEAMRSQAGYPPPQCVDCPSWRGGGNAGDTPGAEQVVLSRSELARLIAEAVARFGRA